MFELVNKAVRQYIKNHKRIPGEMKHSLKKSNYLDQYIKRLSGELQRAQHLQIERRGKRFKPDTIKSMCAEFTEVFLTGIENAAERKRESEIEKYRRVHAADEVKDMQSTLEGKSSGVFEDMGLVIPEDQQDQTENHIKEPLKDGRIINIAKG